MRPALKILLIATIVVTAIPLLGLVRTDLERRRLEEYLGRGEAYYLPHPAVLRALTVGYNEFGSDLLWVRAIAYFADHLTSDHDLEHLAKHLKNVVHLDDHFRAVFRYGAAMLAAAATNEAATAAIDLLKRGHKSFPNDWRIAFSIGSYYMWEIRAQSPAEKRRLQREGAEWIRRAALLGADMPWLPALAAKIFTDQGQRALAIRHLEELYLTTQDKKMKQQIAAKLRNLQAKGRAAALRRQATAFRRHRKASPLKFLPEDLFAIVYLEPLPPFKL